MRELTPEEIDAVGRWPVTNPRVGAQDRNDFLRKASPIGPTIEDIEALERVLAGDLSAYSPAGISTMRDRLLILKAPAGLLPLSAAAE